MSVEVTNVESKDAAADAEQRQPATQRRRAGRKPALSMLAQGEPLLWLTGGSLAVCLAMIVGLLGLIVFFGMITFWPTGVVTVQLRDGTRLMGEIARGEQYTLTSDMLAGMPEAIADAAREQMAGQEETPARRRLLRTGNYELTNSHFHWFSDFEVEPGSETHSEWAMVVERMEWGRFYGEPTTFVVRHERPVPDEEQQWLEMLQFLQSNQYRVTDADERAALEEALVPLRERHAEIRRGGVAEFLKQCAATDGTDLEVVIGAAPAVPLEEVSPDDDVTEAREIWSDPETAWAQYNKWHDEVRARYRQRRDLEKHDVGQINRAVEEARLGLRREELESGAFIRPLARDMLQVHHEIGALDQAQQRNEEIAARIRQRFGDESPLGTFASRFAAELKQENTQQADEPRKRLEQFETELAATPPTAQEAVRHYLDVAQQSQVETDEIRSQIDEINRENARYELLMVTAQGQEKALGLSDIVRAYPAQQLSFGDKVGVYFSRWSEFLMDDPREANSEGGVFPAIWGTIAMTLIMALFVVPFGVLAALYLREYAKAGIVVSAVRISINNLAGVPSIVFGVFGLSFFCYIVGTYMDGGPGYADLPVWPKATWFGGLAGLAVIGLLAFTLGLYSLARQRRGAGWWQRLTGYVSILAWLAATALGVILIATTPFFDGWYATSLPERPTFGKPGLLWGSLTLALLTLPVVIVATEEALAAVPNSLREGSYACGAGKWQTIRRIVLPHAMPGIMTGMILAMARGAGEVAPLMLVGAVKLAQKLPIDFVDWSGKLGPVPSGPLHANRSFMHLGYHIFDLGFHSPNAEAAKLMVFTTTLLLITIIALLNIAAIWLRSRLRKRFQSSAF